MGARAAAFDGDPASLARDNILHSNDIYPISSIAEKGDIVYISKSMDPLMC